MQTHVSKNLTVRADAFATMYQKHLLNLLVTTSISN